MVQKRTLKLFTAMVIKKDRLEAWQVFYCGCCLVLADCRGGEGCLLSCCEMVVVGVEAAGVGVLADDF